MEINPNNVQNITVQIYDVNTLINFQNTSKVINKIMKDESLWINMLRERFGQEHIPLTNQSVYKTLLAKDEKIEHNKYNMTYSFDFKYLDKKVRNQIIKILNNKELNEFLSQNEYNFFNLNKKIKGDWIRIVIFYNDGEDRDMKIGFNYWINFGYNVVNSKYIHTEDTTESYEISWDQIKQIYYWIPEDFFISS